MINIVHIDIELTKVSYQSKNNAKRNINSKRKSGEFAIHLLGYTDGGQSNLGRPEMWNPLQRIESVQILEIV